MTYDELLTLLEGLSGRMVEATIRTPYEDIESGSGGEWFGGFSGIVDSLGGESPRGDHRTLYWSRESKPARPDYGSITVWRDGLERVEVRASGQTVEEALADGPEEHGGGSTWNVDIYQRGLMVELTIYV
jgi:hypothetical protein